jgi:hypothetical protein
MVVQERAATAVLGPQPAADPLAPGQFALRTGKGCKTF